MLSPHHDVVNVGEMMRNEHPIIMSGESVRAIIDGRKTQTRRLVNLDTLSVTVARAVLSEEFHQGGRIIIERGRHRVRLNQHGAVIALRSGVGLKPGEFDFRCPYLRGQTTLVNGDRPVWTITPSDRQHLRIREAFQSVHLNSDLELEIAQNIPKDDQAGYWHAEYQATCEREDIPWHQAIYMPNWAVRLRPESLLVRLQRLHDITDSDAQAEAVMPFFDRFPMFGRDQKITSGEYARDAPYRASYAVSWDEINGDRALWVTNPWVWAVTMGQVNHG